MYVYWFLCLWIFGSANFIHADKCTWANCPAWPKNDGGLNVHIIPHTHDDLGWIKTVDEYYTGAKPNLVPVGVQYIFDTVIDELEKSTDRRFSYAETGFLTRWLEDRDEKFANRLKKLVAAGQFEFIGGGWVQPDEAASHYVELIDQYSLGLRKLNATFGECGRPKVAWQIDPFGHSREHANLVSLIGYEALFFSRIHYLEADERIKNKSLEFIWNASDDLKTNILTGVFDFRKWGYGPPTGFCFDQLCSDDPIVDNANLQGYNVDEKVDKFLSAVKDKASTLKHKNVMILMGGDFTYTNAHMWYSNLDKLIRAVNAKSKKTNITLAYSTPSCYVQSLNEASPRLPQKSDDFFPYASSNHTYWTGYFTSKPGLKGLIRKSSAFLQLVRQLDSFTSPDPEVLKKEEILERAIALTMHHDAVTGTSKENVTYDYERRLLKGISVGEEVLNKALQKLTKKSQNSTDLPHQSVCTRLNESVCDATRQKKFAVTVFNANSKELNTVVRIPYYGDSCVVKSADNEEVRRQLQKTFFPETHRKVAGIAPNELSFSVNIPALGFKTYFVNEESIETNKSFIIENLINFREKPKSRSIFVQSRKKTRRRKSSKNDNKKSISNEVIRLTFDENGFLSLMENLQTKEVYELTQEFLYYKGTSDLNKTTQADGAYILRPNGTEAKKLDYNITLEIIEGPIVNESRQIVAPWISQAIRLFPNKAHVEFEWTVGPITKEKDDPIAKEVITRYTVKNLTSNGLFQTDANGRQMIHRKRNFAPCYTYNNTEPIAANYYPVTSRISLLDAKSQLSILTDRAEGGSSLADGQIELLLHRRAFHDDGWGVEEALDEPGEDDHGLVVRGKHWLSLGSPDEILIKQRTAALELFYEPILTFSSYETIEKYNTNFVSKFDGLTKALPPEINLLTLKRLDKNTILIRLEHIFQNGENPNLSTPIRLNIDELFTRFQIISIEELNLGGNVKSGIIKSWPRSWNSPKRLMQNLPKGNTKIPIPILEGITIELKPMEIKTLILNVSEKS